MTCHRPSHKKPSKNSQFLPFTQQVSCVLINLSNIKGGIFTLYERIQKEQRRLREKIDLIKKELKALPEGKLICSQNGNRVKWYVSDGHTKVYIPKRNRAFAEQLAKKKFLTLALEDLSQELRALDFYLSHHSKHTGKSEHLLRDIQGFNELLSPYFQPVSQQLSTWQHAPYEQNPKYPEQLIHKTPSGHLVRSKSEAMIALYLHTEKIPFRYECALQLGESTLYPDFTIIHPATGEMFYWEHFGMMDEPFYYQKAFPKLQLYASYGIIPSINLITTYETKKNPLGYEVIEKTIEHYFK